MTISVTNLGHAAFQVSVGGKSILVDPFLDGNPSAKVSASSIAADAILITHGHEDHVGDTVSIAKRTGALVIANFEIIAWLQGQGLTNVHAQHGSALPDGSYGGVACGIVLKTDEGTIYFSGDTGLFSDMQLIGDESIDLAVLPIGDNFTMGPDDALRAVQFIRPKRVVPSHYDTWPVIAQDANAWSDRVHAETDAKCTVLKVGESLTW